MSDDAEDQGAQTTQSSGTITLSDLRHELLTPVNQILGYAELLKEEAADAGLDDFQSDLEKIRRAAKELIRMIRDHLASADRLDL